MSDPATPLLTFSQIAPFLIVAVVIFFLNLLFCCYLMRLKRQGRAEIRHIGYRKVKFDPRSITNDICAVCLEDFKAKEQIGVCKCRHGFHIGCISKWLEAKRTCPICNTCVIQPSERTYLISTMCSLFLFVIFSCYDQYERRNIPSKRGAFKRMKYTSKKVKNDTCAVCLEEFHSKEKIGLCHCQHGYHVKCISTWLQSKSKCPMCNAQVSDDTNKPYTRAASAQLVSPLPTR